MGHEPNGAGDRSRRTFLKQAAAGAAVSLMLPRWSWAAPPSGRLQHACVGVMGMGRSDRGEIDGSGKVDIVALCDVDQRALDQAAQAHPGARLYRDWREMLDREAGNIDSVNVAIPDHMHAAVAMTAIRAGKHVYCQKPLTHDVHEARQLTLAAREAGVVTQMGIQIHAHDFYRTAVQWIRDGAIGKVVEWHSWSSASYSREGGARPEGEDAVPEGVDWDHWLGTAPERPYKDGVYHPFEWRRWRDFGTGATGDFGCHIFDPVFTALGVLTPLSLSAQVESQHDEVWPAWSVIDYEFAGSAMTVGKTIRASWSDGGKQPDKRTSPHLADDYTLPNSGSMIIGEDGTLVLPHIAHPELHPVEKFRNYPRPKLEPRNHYHEFVEAALGNGTAGAGFDFSGPLAEAVLLGTIAGRFPGKRLEWNADRMRFTNARDANDWLRRKYRNGWKVRGL